jgi:hypothetical protein
MQDRITQIDEIFLQRTAGPYIRVKSGTTQSEYILSALPAIADMAGGAATHDKDVFCHEFRGPLRAQSLTLQDVNATCVRGAFRPVAAARAIV